MVYTTSLIFTPGRWSGVNTFHMAPHDSGSSDPLRMLMDLLGVDPAGPEHGELGHKCPLDVLSQLEDPEVLAELAADNVPIPWLLTPPAERANKVRQAAAEFHEGLNQVLMDNHHKAPGDPNPREHVVKALNILAKHNGKPPRMLLAELEVNESELDPAILAAHDQRKAEYIKRLRRFLPHLADSLNTTDDRFREVVEAAVPEGFVLWDGHMIPQSEKDEMDRMEAEVRQNGRWDKDNPLRVELGEHPFILIKAVPVPGSEENLSRMEIRLGGGADSARRALALLEAAREEMMEQYSRMAAKHAGEGCEHDH